MQRVIEHAQSTLVTANDRWQVESRLHYTSWAQCALTLVLAVIFVFANSGYGQNSNSGDIRGTVTDSSGAVLPGVTVTLLETTTGVTKILTTNSVGVYDAVSILPGKYTLTFTKPAFKTLTRSGIILTVETTTVNAQLEVGATTQQVVVNAAATRLQTDTAEQSTAMTFADMDQLPNVGEGWESFVQSTMPGVNGGANAGVTAAIDGTMPYFASYLSDGGDITLPVSFNFPSDTFETISEVKIDTSNFSAEYGNGSVIMNQITKSGTNTFHGAAYSYIQNSYFNSRRYFAPSVPMQRWNNWGGSIGGPILRNKAFFYGNYNRIHDNYEIFPFYTYPTTDMRAGNYSDTSIFPELFDPATYNPATGLRNPFPDNKIPVGRMDPVALAIQKYLPMPNLPGTYNNWQKGLTDASPYTAIFGRLDYDITPTNRLSITNTDDWYGVMSLTPDCPMDCTFSSDPSDTAQITDVWSHSSTMVNEFRFAFVRSGAYQTPPTLGKNYPQAIGMDYAEANIFPNISIAGSPGFGGTSIGSGTTGAYNEYQFEPSDVYTLVLGKNIFKFGGEYLIKRADDLPFGGIDAGNFTFNGYYTQYAYNYWNTGMGYADFLLGQVQFWGATNQPLLGMRNKVPQLFAQDDIKLRPNLTLNLGLRYEHQGGWWEEHNRIGNFDPSIMNPVSNTLGAMWFGGQDGRTTLENSVNSFLPRVGFSYLPRPNLAIRAGYGRYTYAWSQDIYALNALGYGADSTGTLTDNTGVSPVLVLSDQHPNLPYVKASTNPGAYNGGWVPYYPFNTPVAIINEATLSVQVELPKEMVAEVAYVANYGSKFPFITDINVVPAADLGPNGYKDVAFPQYYGIYGEIFNNASNYNALQASIKKQYQHGLGFNVNYTWSHLLNDQDTAGWAQFYPWDVYQNGLNPSANYGPSEFDLTNMFKVSAIYRLPFGVGEKWLNRQGPLTAVLGGWQGSIIFDAQSGFPYLLYVGSTNLSGTQSNGYWYPNRVGNPHLAHPTIHEWFNTAAYAVPAAYTLGDERRNSLRGPGSWNANLSAAKNVPFNALGHSMNMQIRIDAFNAFNHTAFGNPDGAIGTPGAGIISSAQVSGRTVQIGARFSF